VCSLIGRALDDIVGASVPEEPKKDRWDYESDDDFEEDWKTA